MLSLEVAPEHAAHGLLCSPRPSSLSSDTEGSAQGHQLPVGFSTWSKDTQLCPGLKPPTPALQGLQGPARAGDHSPASLLSRRQQGTHTAWEMPERKTVFINTETETAGQDLPWFLLKNGKEARPLQLYCTGSRQLCGTVWVTAEVPLPKFCLWSRLLIGFRLELGTRTFSSYPMAVRPYSLLHISMLICFPSFHTTNQSVFHTFLLLLLALV